MPISELFDLYYKEPEPTFDEFIRKMAWNYNYIQKPEYSNQLKYFEENLTEFLTKISEIKSMSPEELEAKAQESNASCFLHNLNFQAKQQIVISKLQKMLDNVNGWKVEDSSVNELKQECVKVLSEQVTQETDYLRGRKWEVSIVKITGEEWKKYNLRHYYDLVVIYAEDYFKQLKIVKASDEFNKALEDALQSHREIEWDLIGGGVYQVNDNKRI